TFGYKNVFAMGLLRYRKEAIDSHEKIQEHQNACFVNNYDNNNKKQTIKQLK
ncbi:5361_t:CDS:1, partial [Entrophospora sp. SA101]